MSNKQTPVFKPFSNDNENTAKDVLSEGKKKMAAFRELLIAPHDDAHLNALEKDSVEALIDYAVCDTEIAEDVIKCMLFAEFNASKMEDLTGRDYDKIVRFLVGLEPRSAIH